MEKFLETVARYIYSNHKSNLEDVCIIFPNRRAGVFFNAYLQKLLDKPVIGPKVTTVNDFISGFSEKQQADRLKLISILYEVFREYSKTSESFDEFYFWGEVLLSDFNDIDKYLTDPSALFKNMADLKEIEAHFDFLEESQKEILRRFWGSLGKWEEFKNQEEFLKLWKILNPVYSGFREKLEVEGIAYDGMIYREIAEKIKAGEKLPLKAERYFIVGLNVLNGCEKVVFKYLKSTGKAAFLWDYDILYLDDLKNEAGFFIRENIVAFPPPKDFLPQVDCFGSDKKIEFISVASTHGQAQIIPQTISQIDIKFDNTAIVLADEALLFPVLGAIPESVGSVNVTMGYPVKNSTVYGFISMLASLIKNTRVSENQEIRFYYRFVFDILNHQLLGGIETEAVSQFLEKTKKNNQIYISPEDVSFSDLHKLIFNIPQNVAEYGIYFKGVLKTIYFYLRKQQPENKILPELIATIFKALEKLDSTISDVESVSGQTISPPIFFRLLNQYLNQVSVSYEGEPLSGLQVMGILETRCLDFENVVIIGFNEDFWPRPSVAPSYIPHNLRFVFGLPSIDNQDAMYAYYFYRLIQKAENVTATFNTIKEGINTGELSRFGYQLIYDSNHQVEQKNLEYRFRSNQLKPLSAFSSNELVQKLLARYTVEKPLSPSALIMYLNCKYKFYLRHIVGLPEAEEVAEEVDSRLFGNIFHKSVESLYKQAGNQITEEWIDKVLKDKIVIEQIVRKAFAEEYIKSDPEKAEQLVFEGNVRLTYEFIRSYIVQLLKVDRKITPFEIVSLEKQFTWEPDVLIKNEIKLVPVGGIIDRIDRVGGLLRVIDYKTGLVNSMLVNSIESIFDRSLKNQKKEAFQAFLYSLILKRKYFQDEDIAPGIYGLRNLYSDNFTPFFRINKLELDFSQIADEFEIRFKDLVNEILSSENEFCQTEIVEHCSVCPYKVICHRG